ncbi:MAG: secondary thiamine-phosphate synthase enzyme YjbQ [Vulcanisaeta sp.]|nr:secondary thiamine-phosphate synthase enzyme YjbQ [Vulcanisaeta sp.]MCG2869689.1 secondary thiamine-phosphate synthase enzyme YjbQ [Vulcanisaeta sp.]MCG2886661.1 secondary thiamine-phosphate synthase enzyme YjbQ [Vulcanisaeta sp.]
MKVFTREFTVTSRGRREVINITDYVEAAVRESGVRNGLVLVFLPHATAGLFANEDEPRIRKDYEGLFERLVPENGDYEHNKIDNNADAHLLASLFKQFFVLPIIDGRIVRGTWQEILLADFDGPRTRRVVVLVLGE